MAPSWLSVLSAGPPLYVFTGAALIAEAALSIRTHAGDLKRRWGLHGVLFGASRVVGWAIAFLTNWAADHWRIILQQDWAGWAHLAGMILLLDLALYGSHRASHRFQPLWRLHSLHHSDAVLDVSTTWRHHPGEMIWSGLVIGCVAALCGVLPLELGLYAVLSEAVQIVAHADLPIPQRFGRWASWLFVTPGLHHAHHSPERWSTDSNYGEVFSVWDRLFGTFNPQANVEMVFGLAAGDEASSAFMKAAT